jgi:hypothetical protein
MNHLLKKNLLLILALLLSLPAMAASKDICWKIQNLDVDAGTLRLQVVHSIANEHFVLNGVRELADGVAYAVTGGAVHTDDGYKASLLETGGGDTSDWSTNWSLNLNSQTFDGRATAITSVIDQDLVASTEAGVFDATLVSCKPKNNNGN